MQTNKENAALPKKKLQPMGIEFTKTRSLD